MQKQWIPMNSSGGSASAEFVQQSAISAEHSNQSSLFMYPQYVHVHFLVSRFKRDY